MKLPSNTNAEKKSGFFSHINLESLINLIPTAVYCCDTEGNIVYFNDKAVELWGRRPNTGDIIEKFCGSYKIYSLDGSYLPHEKCPMGTAIIEKLPSMNGEIIIERPDNSWVYARASIKSLRDETGKVVGAINSLIDISVERDLNLARETTMENFRFLANNIPQLVWMAQPDGMIDYYNENWLTFSGLSMEELKKNGWVDITHPEDCLDTLNKWTQAVKSAAVFQVTSRLQRGADQTYRWFLMRAVPMKDEEGKVVRWFATCTDISDQKNVEEELALKNLKLNQANKELIKINNQLDTFIYTASHDLKAPILNIEGLVRLLSNNINTEIKNTENENIDRTLNYINTSITKFKSTLNDLTEIVKIQKKLEDNTIPERVNLQELINEVIHDIGNMIKSNNAKVTTDLSECQFVNFSKSNLKSVIYNLLSNGIKYKDPGRTPEIFIRTVKKDDSIVLSISDNGLGFSSAVKDKLFTPFKRFHPEVEGSGIGLYIVKKIIDNSDGKIEVESKIGTGSTFSIFIKS